MKDLVRKAVDYARSLGARYADARVVHQKSQDLSVRNGELRRSSFDETLGIGIRVIVNGGWGFASTDDLSDESIKNAAKLAVAIARASAGLKLRDAELAPEQKYVVDWASPCAKDPFLVSVEDKVGLMFAVDDALRGVKGVTFSSLSLAFRRDHVVFANSEGSLISQVRIRTGAGLSAGAFRNGEYQSRSYPCSFGGQWALKGYELVEELKLKDHAAPIAEEAVALLDAPQCPSAELDLILESSQLALQVHESVGHPTELDRVLGSEANYAGTSWVTYGKPVTYGSKLMNIVADARLEHGPSLGCFAYDDEGVPAQEVDIVKEGQLVGFLTSRETAKQTGLARSGGCMRASSWNRIPLIRMTQMSLKPGEWDLDALVADTKNGILMATNKSWSIDDKRLNFQFGCEVGWLIKDGRKVGMVKNPTYAGITPQFWGSMDAVCGQKDWILWGIPNCGKGQPGQSMEVAHGAAPARFRNVRVGVP